MTEQQEAAKPKILIVEDEAIVAFDLKSGLEKLGYSVLAQVNSAEKALEMIEQNPPDLILMDIILKGKMDGIEAAEIIRSRWDIPVVFVTSYADQKRLDRAKLVYPFGYILKPFQDNDLKVTVEMALYVSKVDRERRKAEEALREKEEAYRNLFENANETILVAQDGKVILFNPRTVMMTGYPAEELLSRPFIEFIHPDDRDMVMDRHVKRLKGEELLPIYDFRIIHKDGNVRWVELNAIVINWMGGTATLNFLSDITERK
ncbi:MAG: PAS domain S-box protein [Pseudomonadota bacterium]